MVVETGSTLGSVDTIRFRSLGVRNDLKFGEVIHIHATRSVVYLWVYNYAYFNFDICCFISYPFLNYSDHLLYY